MADYEDNEDELLNDAESNDEEDSPSALPLKNRTKKNLVPVQEADIDVGALENFDFESLIKKPEAAPAPPPAEKGVLQRAGDAIADTAKAAGKAVKNFVAPDKDYIPGSVMNDVPQGEPLKQASRAPLAPGVRKYLENQFDAATPEQRVKMASQPGAAGDVWREREERYGKRTQESKILNKLDPSAEARTSGYIDEGMDGNIARQQGRMDAARGVEGKSVGQATNIDFDAELAEKYAKDPVLSTAAGRIALKGFEGYKQGVLGITQFAADAVGADEFAAAAGEVGKDSQKKVDALGEAKNYGQRMFEGAAVSIAQQLPLILASGGSQAVALGLMAAQSYGQSYLEGRNAGQQPDQARVRAAEYAAMEVLGEKFGLGDAMGAYRKLLNGGEIKAALRMLVPYMAKQVPGEVVTTLGQFAVDKQGAGYGIRTEADLADLKQQLQDTIVQTVMQGGLMSAPLKVAQGVKNNPWKQADKAVASADIGREIEGAVSEVPDSDEYTQQEAVRRMSPTGTLDGDVMPPDGSVPETTPEPQGDIEAQVGSMLDPNSPKDAVFIARGTAVPEGLPPEVQVIEREEGTLLTTNPEKAQVFGSAEQMTDEMVAEILGIPKSKAEVLQNTDQPGVTQARDAEGNVVNEAVTDGTGANEAAVGQTVPPGGTQTTTTPEQAQAERAAKVAKESIVPGQQDTDIEEALRNVKTVDEDGNEVAVAPPTQQEAPQDVPAAPPTQTADGPQSPPAAPPAPPVEAPKQKAPGIARTPPKLVAKDAPPAQPPKVEGKRFPKPKKAVVPETPEAPKAPKAPKAKTPKAPKAEAAPATKPLTRETFAKDLGAQSNGPTGALTAQESAALEKPVIKGDVSGTFKALQKSGNPVIRFVAEAGLKSSERAGKPLQLKTSDKEVTARIKTGYNDIIKRSREVIGLLDAARAAMKAIDNHKGAGLPASVKTGKLGKLLRESNITTRDGAKRAAQDIIGRFGMNENIIRANSKAALMDPKNVGGLHDPLTHQVLMRKANAMKEHVVAHELTHALTTEAINNPTDAQQPAVQALHKLFEHVKNHGTLRYQYGLTNVKEFIAEGFSNPDFQFELATIPYEGTTAWGKFTQMIARLLGIPHNNAFMELMAIGESIMDTNVNPGKATSVPNAFQLPDLAIQRAKGIQGNRFALPKETRLRYLQAGLQDRFNRINVIQRAILEQGGSMTRDADIYTADERQHGATASKVGWFTKYKVKPLFRDMARAGVDPDDVGLFLYAQHAKERNIQIAKINPNMPDGGSGMTNAEAANLLQQFRGDPQYAQIKAFADRLLAVTKDTQKIMLEGHLVDQDTVDAWNTAYGKYVPLKGFEKYDDFGAKQPGTGRGYDVRGLEARRALGRQSKAGNIIENIIMDHERAINRAERNKVARALMRFVLQNPDSNLWEINKVVYKNELRKDPSPGHVIQKLETVKDKDRTITVKENGKEFFIVINDARMFQQLQGEKGALNMEGLSAKAFKLWSGFNRFLATMWTALNPAFVIINAARDTLVSVVHGSTAVGPGFAAKVVLSAPRAAAAIMRADISDRPTVVPATGPTTWREWYQQYQDDGGKAGFYMFSELEDKERELRGAYQRAFNMARGTTKKKAWALSQHYAHLALDLIMDVNGGIENMNRLAAYRVAIEQYGMTREEAASLAKNLTVNFNRKGSLAPAIGSFYLFFNPAIQGTARMIRSWQDNKAMMGGFLTSMMAVGFITAMMGDGDEDENGMPYWDKIPAYEKEKNIIVPVGGGNRITIPVPYGYGFFIHLGMLMREAVKGRPLSAVGFEAMNSALKHFMPIGVNLENPATMMVPTVGIPILEAAIERKATGQPLMPREENPDGSMKMDHERYWRDTDGHLTQKITTFLAELTADMGVNEPLIDISPETVNNFAKGYLGGGGTFAVDFGNTVYQIMTGNTLGEMNEKNSIPVWKSLYKADAGKSDTAYYMKHSAEALSALDRFKKLQDKDDPVSVKRLEKLHDLAELGLSVKELKKSVAKMNKIERAIRADKDMDEAERKASLKEIADAKRELYSQWNAKFFRVERKLPEKD